ncbi:MULTISPECIES: PP2C family protein-serine/threonine phosphatase [Metabacillus]|jgi:phosphoserine phosphatase RsbU/P|uniref:PP2C family protein-serine/threonine phosphatase n=1 Tax=Metabacillus hrfriensis TaxID=3048891 RepID=A0ACD4RCE6_9BACI|nr:MULTISPECIES: PP2C family protein-serine/threonine phosphatase [Metabacillus]UAL52550.1 PP2C family protein-serine/threonine phosphatase [Metabacillus dongyingensis]USK28861.1 PP2C family protein-serine/threonine phosphatase [Bacillus sp. CMF21]WHZ58077.1 PP2C family protein-serine/threonine phosphatase [Metabacillus sp. CT-WN-B3]
MDFKEVIESKYQEILSHYMQELTETALYQGQKFSRKAIEEQVPPEEIISLHRKVLQGLFPDVDQDVLHSLDFLLEVMMGYGLAYQEHQSLRDKQQEIKSEIQVALNVQQMLLETSVPTVPNLDIGAISVPAKHMNGDYYHFVYDEESVSIAIADVIGKGIPAALCMSMIKYAMDSLPESRKSPSRVLENLNRVVEHNVDPSMFITMFYGMYDTDTHEFVYGSAGHEPGFYYSAEEDRFHDMNTKGLVLGIDQSIKYKEYSRIVEKGDMIVLLSDGVTESKTNEEEFIERDFITDLIKKYSDLNAQGIVDNIYKDFLQMQDFELRDDFTLIILKREV